MQQTGKRLRVSSSPHIRAEYSTGTVMLQVIIALLPAGAFGVWYFGAHALALIVASVTSAVVWEAVIQKMLKKPVTISDLSAVVTGLLLAYNLPPKAPIWLAVVGSGIAIVLVKQIFGGVGQNFMNPALTARAILLASWMRLMTGGAFDIQGALGVDAATAATVDAATAATLDAVSFATPLAATSAAQYPLWELFIGRVPGCIGEVSKLALLVGGVYLLATRVISWHTPLSMLATAFLLFFIQSGSLYGQVPSATYQLLSGGLILGALFMATDYATAPVTPLGKIIMGVGAGVLIFVIRTYNPSYPEGCTYAILIMNVATPLIDRFTRPRVYGEVNRRHA